MLHRLALHFQGQSERLRVLRLPRDKAVEVQAVQARGDLRLQQVDLGRPRVRQRVAVPRAHRGAAARSVVMHRAERGRGGPQGRSARTPAGAWRRPRPPPA